MNLKKQTALWAILILLTSGSYLYLDSRITKQIILEARQVSFASLNEMEASSTLIALGEPLSNHNFVKYDKTKELPEDAFTVTDFRILKVMANQTGRNLDDGELIKVAEPSYILKQGLVPGKTRVILENYKMMNLNSRYIIFLRPDSKYADMYVISGGMTGRHYLEASYDEFDGVSVETRQRATQLKKQILEKYGLD